jgi:hypothetical protein
MNNEREHLAFTVILSGGLTETELQPIFAAIRMIRGINDVEFQVIDTDVQIAKNHLRRELMSEFVKLLRPPL